MKYKFLPHTADTIFEAYGKNFEEAFANAALAMEEIMTDTSKVEPKVEERIEAFGSDMKELLYDFLERFLVLKDVKNLVFSEIVVESIEKSEEGYKLSARARGEEFDSNKHEDRTLVKAVTYHGMKIGEKDGEKFVQVLVDI